MIEVSRDLVIPQHNYRQRQDLQRSPEVCDTRTRAGPSILNSQGEGGPGKQSAKMSSIINKSAADKTDSKIDKDDRQHAGAERAFEAFRKFTPKLDAKHEEHAHQSKQRSGRSGGRHIHTLKNKASEKTGRQLRAHRQVTRNDSRDAG